MGSFALLTPSGCGGPSRTSDLDDRGLDRAQEVAARRRPAEPASERGDAAIVNGSMLPFDALKPRLAEMAGGEVLEEVILEMSLERELARRAIRISDADVQAEQDNLLFLVLGRATDDPEEAGRIIEATRRARGLGPVRYQALLQRNAMLRRLVRDDVTIESADVERLYSVRHGEKVRARIIVVPTERRAAELRRELIQQGATPDAFALMAMEHSADATSARGGLIEVFSTRDPAYPAAAREALDDAQIGELTPVIGLEAGFAFLLLEARIPPSDTPLDDVCDSLRRELRLRQERLLMQDLALDLIAAARVTPVDRQLGWSWQSRAESRSP